MVLTIRTLSRIGAGLLCAAAHPAYAQSVGSTAPAVRGDDPEYQMRPVQLGAIELHTGTEFRAEYDDNIYARPVNAADDFIGIFEQSVDASYSPGALRIRAGGSVHIRRFADYSSENSEAGGAYGEIGWRISPVETLTATGSWNRAVEDRGDPEARIDDTVGPRLYDILSGNLRFRRTGARTLIDVEGAVRKTDALASIDSDRDYTSYAAQATFGIRAMTSMFVTATGFVNERDYRISESVDSGSRNSKTYGGRIGVEFDPGGAITGNISGGIFKFDPSSHAQSSRTGLSVAGELTFRPTRRSAVILRASNGDVATFRNGATSRTDTVFQLTMQQEIRHNFYARVGAGFRQSKFIGTGDKEKTYQINGELEYIVNKNFSIAAGAQYSDRSSDNAFEEFNRLKGWIALRLGI